MDLLKKTLLEFNNKYTNHITPDEIDNDEQLMFTLLDMQKFAEEYLSKSLSKDGCYDCGSENLKPKEYTCKECSHFGYSE